MSIFSSKTETYVSTSISRLIKDEQITDSVKQAVVASLYTGDDMIDAVLEANATRVSSRAERMYAYASTHSPYGLPTGEVYSSAQGQDKVQAYLDALEGSPVEIFYCRFGGANLIHMAWMSLVNSHGYSTSTNTLAGLSAQRGTPVYVDNLVVEIPSSQYQYYDSSELACWGVPANGRTTPLRKINLAKMQDNGYKVTADLYAKPDPVVSPDIPSTRVKVYVTWDAGTDNEGLALYGSDSFYVYPFEVNDTLSFFHAEYRVNGVIKYFMYRYGSEIIAELDSVFESGGPVLGDFYPNIYHRLNMSNVADNKASDAYKAMARMSKYLSIDYLDLNGGIHENPDVGQVEQAFMTIGVPADSQDPLDIRYLFDFFTRLHQVTSTFSVASMDDYLKATDPTEAFLRQPTGIAMSVSDGATNSIFSNYGTLRNVVNGKVTGIGGYTSHIDRVLTQYGEFLFRVYRYQATASTYVELRVYGLSMKYQVRGKHYTVAGDDVGEILLVPVDRIIINGYSAKDKERLITRSFHVVCNCLVNRKLSWYQRKWFADFLFVLAIVLLIISLGASSPLSAALAALSAGAYLTALYYILYELVIFYLKRELFRLFVKAVGVKFAFIVAVAATVAGLSSDPSSAASASSSMISLSSSQLLVLSTGLVGGIGDVTKDNFGKLKNELSAFQSDKTEKNALLEQAQDLLETSSLLSPITVLGEEPWVFYNRTVHSGNIGTLVFDDIGSYVERSLKLPSFVDSAGGVIYG